MCQRNGENPHLVIIGVIPNWSYRLFPVKILGRKCNKFFSIHQIEEIEKMEVVDLYLDGKADVWYQSFRLIRGRVSWPEFSEALLRRFGDRTGRDEI